MADGWRDHAECKGAAGRRARLAKGVLSQKMVLAYILKRTVPEFESASLDDIANIYIEGTPEVSTVPVSN